MPGQLHALSVSVPRMKGDVQTHGRGEIEFKTIPTCSRIMAEVLAWFVASSREVRLAVSGYRDK